MQIYDKPTKILMREFAAELSTGQQFSRKDAVAWFGAHYPRIKPGTVTAHCEGMSVNSENRKHHPSIKPGSGHDLFWKIAPGRFRVWDEDTDPKPIYPKFDGGEEAEHGNGGEETDTDDGEAGTEFAAERDLQQYLAKNLEILEPGLKLYEEEEINGIEYPAGGRYIDILAVDKDDNYVVIELKVSRGYDRVIGQLLRYMGWIERNLSDGKPVRGWIVARNITDDLKLATSRVHGVDLYEYEINFSVSKVSSD
ncbi:MAG: endonuclease NucS [Nitrospinota bacterium]|nr:endonuclease NucS [Nitrospinota bacterium]